MSYLVERLRAHYEHFGLALFKDAADEIERLQAIVDKLPKTADGAAVVPGMDLYQPNPTAIVKRDRIIVHRNVSVFSDDAMRCIYEDCYSTREAAEAAKSCGEAADENR